MNFAALNENEAYAELERDLRELLEQSKEPGFIVYTRLDEILSCPHRRLIEAKKAKTITAKETILLDGLDEIHALMERTLDVSILTVRNLENQVQVIREKNKKRC